MSQTSHDVRVSGARRHGSWATAALAAVALSGCVIAPPRHPRVPAPPAPPPVSYPAPSVEPPPPVYGQPYPGQYPNQYPNQPYPNQPYPNQGGYGQAVPGGYGALYFYPERGQSPQQQDRDRYECYRYAVRDSGIDPGMTPVQRPWNAPRPYARRDGADVVGGAVAGAAVGAVVSGHRGEGAVIGAIFGALLGAASQESRAQAAEYEYARRAEQAARAGAPIERFRRSMAGCMVARGYSVG